MAGKKVKSEVEGIRTEIRSLSEAVWALRDKFSFEAAAAAATHGTASKNGIVPGSEGTAELGSVAISGALTDAAGSREVRWEQAFPVDALLAAQTEDSVKTLAAIGHRQRLAMIGHMIGQPTTAAELVSNLDLGTTGAAYHHLNVLIAAGLVVQESRGVFALAPERLATIVTILAGLASTGSVVETTEPGEKVSGKGKSSKK